MASCCIPGLFEPIIFNHKTLIDGGVLNNFPIEPLLNHYDFIIGSHCNPYGMSKLPKSMATLVQKALFLAINNNSQSRLKRCNLIIEPPLLKNFDPFDIRKAKEIFKVGYEFTQAIELEKSNKYLYFLGKIL